MTVHCSSAGTKNLRRSLEGLRVSERVTFPCVNLNFILQTDHAIRATDRSTIVQLPLSADRRESLNQIA